MNKAAQLPWKNILHAAGGLGAAGLGGYLGYKVTPHMAGYQDVENAKRMSALIDAIAASALYLGAMTSGKGNLARGSRVMWNAVKKNPKKITGLATAAVGSELIPATLAASHRLSKSPVSMAESMERTSKKHTIPEAVGAALTTPAAKGMGVGAGIVGLAGLGTGLLRRKSEEEEKENTTRPQMVTSDVLKFLVPAILAGGTIGSMRGKKQPMTP